MSCYEMLADSYDGLTQDIDYAGVLRFMQTLLQKAGKKAQSVLDLACGTGSMTLLLAQQGYQTIGADLSEDMLTVASEKLAELDENCPLLICQPMQNLALPEPVDWVVCCLDSINYLTDPADCRRTFCRVFQNLKPGGVFVFDINTPYKLKGLDGQIFLDENEDTYCVWRAEFSEEENSIFYGMDLFQREGDHWLRSFEEHQEYAYRPEDLQQWLMEAGFRQVEQFGDCRLTPPSQTEQRIYFMAVKEEP